VYSELSAIAVAERPVIALGGRGRRSRDDALLRTFWSAQSEHRPWLAPTRPYMHL